MFVKRVRRCDAVSTRCTGADRPGLRSARGLVRPAGLRCTLQGTVVFERGEPTVFDRAALSKAMAVEDVEIRMDLGDGDGAADLLTSDLGYRYVEVNAEYTT